MEMIGWLETRWPKAGARLFSLVGLVTLAIILGATKLSFLTPPLFIMLLALLLPYKRYGLITRLVIAALFLYCVNCFLGMLFLFAHGSAINPLHVSIAWGILLTGAAFLKQRCTGALYTPAPLFTKEDLASLAVAFLIGLCVSSAPLIAWLLHGNPAATAIKIVSASGDNINHLEIIKGVIFSHGYLNGTDALRDVVSRDFFNYPQGWHLNVVMLGSFLPVDLFHRTIGIVFLYQGALALTCMSFAYLFCFMMFEVARNVQGRLSRSQTTDPARHDSEAKTDLYSRHGEGALQLGGRGRGLQRLWLVLLPFYTLLAWGMWYFDLVIKGFPSFIMLLGLLLLLFICLCEYTTALTLSRTLFGWGTSLLVLGALGVTWLFLLPPLALLVVVVFTLTISRSPHAANKASEADNIPDTIGSWFKELRRWARWKNFFIPQRPINWQWARWQLVLGVAMLPFLLFQLYIQTKYATLGTINTTGNIQHLDAYIIMAVSVVMFIVAVAYRHLVLMRLLGIGLFVLLGYALSISAYQHITLGYQEYYFYKTLFAVLTVLLLIAVPMIIDALSLGSRVLGINQDQPHALVTILLGVCLVLVLASHQFSDMRDYARGKTADRVRTKVATAIAAAPNDDSLPPIFVGDCNHANDYLATHLASVVADKNDRLQQYMYTGGLLATSKARMIEVLRDYHRKHPNTPITIVSLDRGLLATIQLQLGPQDFSYIDIDNGKPKDPATCQHFVH